MPWRPKAEFPVETLRSVQFWITATVLALAPLVFGSIDLFWVGIWTVLLSVSALFGSAFPLNIAQRRVMLGFLGLCGVYALVAALQTVPRMIDGLDDPTWQRANELLKLNSLPRVSGRAEIPLDSVGHFLLLVTSVMSGFCVGTSRRNSDALYRVAQYSVLLYAIYGVAALIFTPNMILWAPKTAYQGSVTSTFINHNTAATFIGAGAILWFCSMFQYLQSFTFSSTRWMLLTRSNEDIAFKIIACGGAALTCFFALLLTGSRGGLISTSFGLLVALGVMVASKVKPRFVYLFSAATLGIFATLLLLSRMGRIASAGVFDDARWRVYEFCIEAIRQRPLLGAGIGTFGDLFPSLRTEDLYSWGVWDYAHSTLLEIAVEMGLPVALMTTLGAMFSLYIVARAALRGKDLTRRSLAAITGVAVLSYTHSLIDFSLQIPGYLIVFGILLGCGLAHASFDPLPTMRGTRIIA